MTNQQLPPPVVTFYETYGSGAAVVGAAVADALGVRFVGQRISSEQLEAAEQRADDSFLTRVLRTLGRSAPGAGAGVYSGEDETRAVSDNIRELRAAAAQGVVVLGRNATVILAELPTAVHVKLDGPLEQRIARGAAEAGIDLAQARARQAREDAARAEMSLRLHNWDPRHTDRFDLVINTGSVSTDEAAELVLAAYRIKARRASSASSPPRR